MPSKMLYNLVCFVLGRRDVFSIKIDETGTVDDLKEISKRNPQTVATVDADAVTLYKITMNLPNYGQYHKIIEEVSKSSYVLELGPDHSGPRNPPPPKRSPLPTS